MRKNTNGFTLMEMLIVAAIIVIVVGISIPVFASQLEKARSATCTANRRSLKALLTTTYMTENTAKAVKDTFDSNTADSKELTCPKKGKIFYELEESTGVVHVYCSIHDSNPKENLGIALTEKWDSKSTDGSNTFKGYLSRDSGAYIDSAAGSKSNYTVQIRQEIGDILTTLGVKTWTIGNTANTTVDKDSELNYTWSTYDVNSADGKKYSQVPAISYNTSTKKYTVGLTNVSRKNNAYNVIAHSKNDTYSKAIAANEDNSNTFSTLAEAQAYYKKLEPIE